MAKLRADGLLSLAWNPITLGCDRPDGGKLYLTVEQAFDIGPDPDFKGEYKVNTREYYYGLYDDAQVDVVDPLIAWHWNSLNEDGWDYPHVHVPVADPRDNASGKKLHVPTGRRVIVEQVIRFAIREGLAVPVEDWEAILNDGQGRFEQFQTQDGGGPGRRSN